MPDPETSTVFDPRAIGAFSWLRAALLGGYFDFCDCDRVAQRDLTRSSARPRRRCAPRLAFVLCAMLLLDARPTRADTHLTSVQALYESARLVVPVVWVVLSSERLQTRISQVGWTTGVGTRFDYRPRLSWVGDLELSPVFSHAARWVYRDGVRDEQASFRNTTLLGTVGLGYEPHVNARLELRGAVLHEWVRDLPAKETEMWERPYGGPELRVQVARLRSEQAELRRWDGVRVASVGQLYVGARTFARVRVDTGVGRTFARTFVQLHGIYVGTTTSNLLTRTLLGGSWDALGGSVLYGHPYGALRAQRAVVGNARVDVELWRGLELGARGAVAQVDGQRVHGEAVQANLLVRGALFTAGAAVPDLPFERVVLFATCSVATLWAGGQG